MHPPSVQRVVDAAAAHGLEIEVRESPAGTRTAEEAAAAVGCVVDQIVKSMIFDTGAELVLALTSGTHRVDGARLALALGVEKCGRADVDAVRATTGYAIGGVPPIGHATPLRSVLDPHLLNFPEVWAAAGTPRHVFGIEPSTLRRIAGATEADCFH
ncbi:MAG: YbaK/EbsC family protein [Acidimicrobiales bacterium]|nr:YbaK/EbsC family protein [Acidimicrobiales bacterium]